MSILKNFQYLKKNRLKSAFFLNRAFNNLLARRIKYLNIY